MAKDRFVNLQRAKALLKGSGAVALLKPAWAKENGIRCGKIEGRYVYSVTDLQAYVERIVAERAASALQSDDVRLWQFVVDTAIEDANDAAEAWANQHLLDAIATSDADAVYSENITLI